MDSLIDSSGKTTSFARLAAGQRLVVVVMKGHWCAVCVKQLERLARLDKQLGKLGVRVVGLNVDPHAKNRALIKKHAFPFPILSDPKHRVLERLELWRPKWGHPLPSLLIFNRCGKETGRSRGRAPGERYERLLLDLLESMKKKPAKCGLLRA
ncbi:peroxiredoxin family protein [Endomicrobium sp. AH-315-J14]|nr:peroxiredoxin family protein [Endomicrobium sp. AH-315-J14]